MTNTRLHFDEPFAYVEIRSKTLHEKDTAIDYRGDYNGMNADIHVACFDAEKGVVLIAQDCRLPNESTRFALHDGGKVIYTYRHDDRGEIRGTSENIYCVKRFPSTDIRGLNVVQLEESGNVNLNIWGNYLTVEKNFVYKVNFLQSVILIKNYGLCYDLEVSAEPLLHGASDLDKEKVKMELDMEPKSEGGITVKVATQ